MVGSCGIYRDDGSPYVSIREVPPTITDTTVAEIIAAARTKGGVRAALSAALSKRFDATSATLTDSGTTALVLALQEIRSERGQSRFTVALPHYACPDLCAAAVHVGARVRLYDTDPQTLCPDLESLERVIRSGVDVVVVAYLYGYPVDFAAVQSLASAHGAAIIEDAAQAAGGRHDATLLGAFGEWSVHSFNRGKGYGGAGGGALLRRNRALVERVNNAVSSGESESNSLTASVSVLAQIVFARPSMYGLLRRVPALGLGISRYSPAHDPHAMSDFSAAMALTLLGRQDNAAQARASTANLLLPHASSVAVSTPQSAHPGYLRLPIRCSPARAKVARSLGVTRSYTLTTGEVATDLGIVEPNQPHCPGAAVLLRELHTIPTHRRLAARDIVRLQNWLSTGDNN